MSYNLEFKESALKEWQKLDGTIRKQFKKKLAERLLRPRIASARLSGMPDCYKIKLKNAGYRLVPAYKSYWSIRFSGFQNHFSDPSNLK